MPEDHIFQFPLCNQSLPPSFPPPCAWYLLFYNAIFLLKSFAWLNNKERNHLFNHCKGNGSKLTPAIKVMLLGDILFFYIFFTFKHEQLAACSISIGEGKVSCLFTLKWKKMTENKKSNKFSGFDQKEWNFAPKTFDQVCKLKIKEGNLSLLCGILLSGPVRRLEAIICCFGRRCFSGPWQMLHYKEINQLITS